MSTESITDRVLRDVLNSDTLGVYCGSDAFINAKRWRFLEAALAVLEERGMLADPADYLAPAEPFDAAEATSAPLDPSKVKAGDTVTLEKGAALVRDVVTKIEPHGGNRRFYVSEHADPLQVGPFTASMWYIVGYGAWTLTDHQPAAKPEPEWKPGTVAVVVKGGDPGAGIEDSEFRAALDVDGIWRSFDDTERTAAPESVRPLVVLDPAEVDRKALEEAFVRAGGFSSNAMGIRAVLRHLGIEATR